MAPKVKFTRAEIIDAAINIIRYQGIDGLTARILADELGSSTKPIFGLFEGMDEVKKECLIKANELYQDFLHKEMYAGEYPPYKASGMGYIKFSIEEKELFKLLFMRDRTGEIVGEDRESIRDILDIIMNNLSIDEDTAFAFHMELWIFVHGIATMYATNYLDWDLSYVSNMLTDVYTGLVASHCEEN